MEEKIIEIDFVNRRRITADYDLRRLSEHTPKYIAWRKKVEARKQARQEMKESCKMARMMVHEIVDDIGLCDMTKKDWIEGISLMCQILFVVFFASVMACVLR